MLNESIFSSSFSELKDILANDLTIFHIAVTYVLMYVIYKSLGRYIYLKTQEHASKINRTSLTLSLLVILLNEISGITAFLPLLPEYRWLFLLCCLIILIAPLSIITYRLIWNYKNGWRERRDWHHYYLPIPRDYYKTNVPKSETSGSISHSWEEEGVESTANNIHSDAMLNILALVVFVVICIKWSQDSSVTYGYYSYAFTFTICLTITVLFLDRSLFSWIHYIEKNRKKLFKKKK